MEKQNNKSLTIGSTNNRVLASIDNDTSSKLKALIANSSAMVVGGKNVDVNDTKLAFDSIIDEFSNINVLHIVNGIKKGSRGGFGIVYKVTPLLMCYWIREYMKDAPYIDVDDWFLRTRGKAMNEFYSDDEAYQRMRSIFEEQFEEMKKNKR